MVKRGSGQVANPYAPMPAPGQHHGACVAHVRVDGLTNPVCILRGQDRDQVIADARELAGLAADATPPPPGPIMKLGRAKR